MNIQGLMKTTLLDYPGLVASTVFLGACNMLCPFCHNMNIVQNIEKPLYSKEDIFSHLKKRSGIIEGVCITGGEPTLNKDLPDFITSIKELGYKVKLDTNGTNPQMLFQLLDKEMVDYVAMDIKSSLNTYPEVCGISDFDTSPIEESVQILKNTAKDYEFRTTLISQYHTMSVMEDIALMLKGASNYYLQGFKDSEFVPNHNLTAPEVSTMQVYRDYLASYIDNVQLRGV